MGVAKMFAHILKNQKVKKSLKLNEMDIADVIKKLE